jgi:hypothetical protein
MAFVHGKDTFVSLDGDNLSTFTKQSSLTDEADAHDVTAYGQDAHVFSGGLRNGTAGMEGTYDNTATTGPRGVIAPLIGTVVTFIRQPEGAGSGLPQDEVSVLVQSYVETNPVADMVSWSVQLQLSGTIDRTAQSA